MTTSAPSMATCPPFAAGMPICLYVPTCLQARGTTMLCLQSRIQNHTRHQALHTEVGVARALQSRETRESLVFSQDTCYTRRAEKVTSFRG